MNCKGCSLEHMADTIMELQAQVALFKMYAPAQRTDTKKEPVVMVGPTNFEYFGVTPE